MVVSRNDSKRRKKEGNTVQGSPKKTKVHAQRKFAQGSQLNSPSLTPVKDKDKGKQNGSAPPADLLPIKRPKTEEFVNFLCFRGSDMLPKSLEFFNEPSIPEPLEDPKHDVNSAGSSRQGRQSDQAGGASKGDAKARGKQKSIAAVQALKKKYQEQRLAKGKIMNKLASKVKGKNIVRTRSAGPLDESPGKKKTAQSKKPVKKPSARLVTSIKAKRKPVLRKHAAPAKRFVPKTNNRGGLRSGGELPPGSDLGIKTDRRPRKVIPVKKPVKSQKLKKNVASRLSDFSSEDEQPLAKKQQVLPKKSVVAPRTTRSGLALKVANSKIRRPTRKTKEAATLFMEMMGKDLRSPKEEENLDEMSVDEPIEEPTPKQTDRKPKEVQEKKGNEEVSQSKISRKEKVIKPGVRQPSPSTKKAEINVIKNSRKAVIERAKLKTKILRRNSNRLVKKEMELQRNRVRTLPRRPVRAVPKPTLKDLDSNESNSEEEENEEEEEEEEPSSSVAKEKTLKKDPNSDNSRKSDRLKTVKSPMALSSAKTIHTRKSVDSTFNDSDEEPLKDKIESEMPKNISYVKEKSTEKKTRSGQIRTEMPSSTRSKVPNNDESEVNSKCNTKLEEKPKVVKKAQSSKSESESEDKSSKVVQNKGKRKIESDSQSNLTEGKKQTTQTSKKLKFKEDKKESSFVSKKDESQEHENPSDLKESKKKSKEAKTVNIMSTDKKDKNFEPKKVMPKKTVEVVEVEKDSHKNIDIVRKEISSPKVNRKNSKSDVHADVHKETATHVPTENTSLENTPSTKPKLEENRSTSSTLFDKEGNHIKEKDKFSKIDSKVNENKLATLKSKPSSKKDENIDDPVSKSKILVISPSQGPSKKTVKREVKESKISSSTVVEKKTLTSIRLSECEKVVSKESCAVTITADEGFNMSSSAPPEANTNTSCPLLSNIHASKMNEQDTVKATNISVKQSHEKSHSPKQKPTLTSSGNSCPDLVQSINQRISVDSKNIDNSVNQILVTNVQPKNLQVNKLEVSELKSLQESPAKSSVKSPKNLITEKISTINVAPLSKVIETVEKKQAINVPKENTPVSSTDSSQENLISLKPGITTVKSSSNTTENKTEPICIPNEEVQSSKSGNSESTDKAKEQNLELHKVLTDVQQQVEAFTSDSTLEASLNPEVLSLNTSLTPIEQITKQTNPVSEPKVNLMDQASFNTKSIQNKDFKIDERKSILKPDSSLESRMKIDSSEMSEKIFSAIDSLMSLKNMQKPEERPEFLYPSMSSLKANKAFEVEPKRHLESDLKRFVEADSKRGIEGGDIKRVKFQDPGPDQVKRVPEHEPKRVTIIEPEVKRNQMPEVDFRRFQGQDNKPKPGPSQVLKGCANPKSMLKPGTLIDIAGISHSPDIMAPLRPGVEGEIIPMNRPVRIDMQDPYRMQMPGAKPYEPKLDQQFYNYRRPTLPSNEKGSVTPQERESAEAKGKVPVNESAWRLAFKNVKDPKSNGNSPAENPVDRKNLSVTALAKRHTIKSKFEGKEKVLTTPQQPVPFLRQTKPFSTLSTNKTKPSTVLSHKAPEAKKSSTNIDPSVLREKEAEITDFVRQMYVEKEMGKPFVVPVVIPQLPQNLKESEGQVLKPVMEENVPSQLVLGQFNQPEIVSSTNLIQYQQITSQLPSQSSSSSNLSPFKKKEESSFKFDRLDSDNSTIPNHTSIHVLNQSFQNNATQNELRKVQSPLAPQAIKIIPKVAESNGNKYLVPADKSSTQSMYNPKGEFPQSSTQPTNTSTQISQQFVPSDNIFKQMQPTRHLSPTRTLPPSSNAEDNLFKETNMPKRTKSPLSYPQPTGRSNSPQSNLGKRNTSSPVSMRPSRNIFKEVVPATRSFSPTSSNTSQTENDAPGNIFSQNSPFKRSISPLCNKPVTATAVSSNVAGQNTTEISKSAVQVPLMVVANPAQVGLFIHQQLSTLAATAIMQSDMSSVSKQTNPIKKGPVEVQEVNKVTNFGAYPEIINKAQIMQPVKTTHASVPKPQNIPTEESKLFKPDFNSEVKPPMTVEQTLKQADHTKHLPIKTTIVPAKPNVTDVLKGQDVNKMENIVKEVSNSPAELKISSKNANTSQNKQPSSIYNQECELDLMSNKKVNMSAEEIKRWLNESSNSVIEHRANCGILENNSCECEHKIIDAQHSIDMMKSESVKPENGQGKSDNVNKDVPKSNETKSVTVKEVSTKVKEVAPILNEVSGSLTSVQLESGDSKKLLNESKDSGNSTIKSNVCTPNKSSESIATEQNTPPSKRTSRQDQHMDFSEVSSPPLRDDVSSNISSSNDETPDKFLHPERRSIFHQRRSALKVKQRRELIAPSKNAFSPENESSVYAFEPDLPPASTPFRRSKPKDGKVTCTTTTDDDENAPSSNSIAVQVNFDNEAVLECSTQTDTQEADDDDTHTFYIPLQQNTADTTKPPMIQGVAVKLDTEGPDQKVIMRAKLVTKPLSTFNQSTSAPGRSLMGARSGAKPEQKVRPLSVKPPVGTVQPTARPKPKPTTAMKEEEPGPSTSKATCSSTSPQAARLAKRLKNKSLSSSESSTPKVAPAKLVEAPTFYPTEKEFEDPLEYIDKITPQAEKYGLCRVVPPKNFKPECKVSDDMRFTAYNQYIHKMLHRWGPNVKEMLAIKKYLATYKITLTNPPLIGGMEVDLPRLYQTVQQFGGLKEVIEKKRWQKVADSMKLPKSSQDRVTKLDDIYCKFLLPYDTLSHQERTKLFEEVEKDWMEREKKVEDSQDSDDDESDSESDIDECIVKGRSMALNAFFRVARNTMSMWFSKTETPSAADVELEFWKHVASRQHHVCVHAGSIDTGSAGYGFPTGKNSTTSRHPWNLKMLTNNAGSILRFLGPIMGVTVPTLHVGMLFSACCWYRDPHGLAWIEYLHTGASKIWYGIPDSSSAQFRSAVTSLVPRLCQDKQLWLASDTAMVPPPLLVERGVSLSRIVQEPGQFIIVFPKAYTSNICTGYVVSESVYFAPPSWLNTAQNLFYEMRESSEPTVFSLEKLLFSIVNDSRSSNELLNQILPIVVSLRDGEVAGRRQLEELGLNASERLNSNKGRKARFVSSDDEEDFECEKCRTNLFISFMSNSHDNTVYCLPHAVELLTHKRSQVKHCTLVYSFSEDELEGLVEKMKSRAENKGQKKIQAKSSKS